LLKARWRSSANDALPDALRAIRAGDMAATVEQSPGKQVRTALDILVDYIRNKKPMQSVTIAPVVIDSSDLDKPSESTKRSRGSDSYPQAD
jgi:inositol transport system substrate-binding protein